MLLVVTVHVIYPDLEWNRAISERKNLPTHCPYAIVHRCPRYFESVSLLADVGIAVKMPATLEAELRKKWEQHELWPVRAETAASASGGETPHCFSNFCPEASFETFKLFASKVIRFYDSLDRQQRENYLAQQGEQCAKDWRWNWEHIEPMHYSDCPIYSKLHEEKPMSQINFHGPVSGQVNVAGTNIAAPIMDISIGELLAKVEASDASPEEKEELQSKLASLLSHPIVAAILGGLVGGMGG